MNGRLTNIHRHLYHAFAGTRAFVIILQENVLRQCLSTPST